jgi:hypothetical protein
VADRYIRVSDEELLRAVDGMSFDHGRTELDLVDEPEAERDEKGAKKVPKGSAERKIRMQRSSATPWFSWKTIGRDDWIWTSDPCIPNAMTPITTSTTCSESSTISSLIDPDWSLSIPKDVRKMCAKFFARIPLTNQQQHHDTVSSPVILAMSLCANFRFPDYVDERATLDDLWTLPVTAFPAWTKSEQPDLIG